jgi:hypothetical protein
MRRAMPTLTVDVGLPSAIASQEAVASGCIEFDHPSWSRLFDPAKKEQGCL